MLQVNWSFHRQLLTPHLYSDKPIVRARLSPSGDGIQVMIYMRDQDDLFARMCNFFDRMAYNIVQAKIYTPHHGYALNSFIVLDKNGNVTKKHIKKIKKVILADTTAIIFALKNTDPKRWNERSQVELTGNLKMDNPFQNLTEDELRKLASQHE